jgi:hypothetical protein
MIFEELPQPEIDRANAGVEWNLFLGEDLRLHAVAQKLIGKVVIADGTLHVIPWHGFSSGGGPMPPAAQFVIKVNGLREAPKGLPEKN